MITDAYRAAAQQVLNEGQQPLERLPGLQNLQEKIDAGVFARRSQWSKP
jgi:hypothetical protein